VIVKLCFFVNVRKARGRNVAGGSRIGRMLAFGAIAAALKGLMGCAGVAKAGEEEGIGLFDAGVSGNLKIPAARGIAFGCVLVMISFLS
jgi:hypothetical protein